jgi:hypothetical protein
MMAPSKINAEQAPTKADRQFRAVPAAKTIVVASTASTAHAKKTERNKASEPDSIN